MIESIKNPLEILRRSLEKELVASFRNDGRNYVASGVNEQGLKVQVTLHREGNVCQVFFAEQDDPHYDWVVIKDIILVSMTKRGAKEVRDFLEMHGAKLANDPPAAQ
jgi:hypothetical protein